MKVLYATDGSSDARHAIEESLRLLPVSQLEATVVSVVNAVPMTYAMEGMAPGSTVVVEQELVSAERDLTEAAELLARAGVTADTIERTGDPASQILEVARELQPDLIVLGSHGRNALERLLLGSVSTQVVHHWPGATLVVRPK